MWARWAVRTTAFTAAECPCGCSCRQQPHNHALRNRPPALSTSKENWVLSPRRYAQKRRSTEATKQAVAFTAETQQAVNSAWYDQGYSTLRAIYPPGRRQLPRSHRAPTTLLNRRRCYGQHISMQPAGFPTLSQPHTTANMQGRCWPEEKSGNHRRARKMRLRNSS